MKVNLILFLASTMFLNDAWAQCSDIPPKETVDNGTFEKGYPKNGTNGTVKWLIL